MIVEVFVKFHKALKAVLLTESVGAILGKLITGSDRELSLKEKRMQQPGSSLSDGDVEERKVSRSLLRSCFERLEYSVMIANP